MVYYFTSAVTDPTATIYVGKDKTENEDLIKYGWEEDFHVDNLSSAHIYLRLQEGQDWASIPKDLVEDCAQLTKANSIEGNKKDNVTVIYTPWSNLKKDGSMAVGQVGFHNQKQTKRVVVATRQNLIVNRLNKTRTEIPPGESAAHLAAEREANLAAKRKVANEALRKKKAEDARLTKERRDAKLRNEADWQALTGQDRVESEGKGNWEGWNEDDFM